MSEVLHRAIARINRGLEMAVKAGDEKAVEELKITNEALEKQIPKKPEFYGDSEDGKLLCPSCSEDLWDIKECGYNGCPYCLQAIDWSGEDE